MEEERKKKKGKAKWIILAVILLAAAGAGIFAALQLNKLKHVNVGNVEINTGTGIVQTGYRNLAVFGVDSREGELESGTNSDTILVCSINNKTKDVKVVSVYRDTYLNDTEGSYRKATDVYAAGGASRSISMLNKNLDLDITDFVTVDFQAIVALVDKIGGIDLEITEEELKWLNGYLVENSEVLDVEYTPLEAAGYQHLTGIQALAYCRIRYTEGWDFKRTERQRQVLSLVFSKAKEMGIGTLTGLVQDLMPYISTSLSITDLISLVSQAASFHIAETTGFPFETAFADLAAGDVVVPVNLAANVARLHSFLFGESDYTPSDAVQEISSAIIAETGIQ